MSSQNNWHTILKCIHIYNNVWPEHIHTIGELKSRLIKLCWQCTPFIITNSTMVFLTSKSRNNSNFYKTYLRVWNEKPTDVTISILFLYQRISTCFGPTGPSSGEFTQLFTQPLVQWLYRLGRVLCMTTYRARGPNGTATEPTVVWTAVWILLRMGL
jgi:hypothetical protein